MYTMHECCALTGLSYDTLKYYCNEGLIPNVKRNKSNNYREFDDDDINWIKSLICLKNAGFLSVKCAPISIYVCRENRQFTSANKCLKNNERNSKTRLLH